MNLPLVSVLITTYNRLPLLKCCISSVLNQSYKNLQIVIIDDCSTDGTYEYLNNIKDPRLEYFKNEKNIVSKEGEESNFRLSHSKKRGKFFINLGDDDYWPNSLFIENCVNIFNQYPSLAKVIGSQVNYYYQEEYILFSYNQIQDFLKNKNNLFYHHDNILPDGFLTGYEYLNLFSKNPLGINISTVGTMFSSDLFYKAKSLQTKSMSMVQAGFELFIPCSLVGDVYYINDPCAVVGSKSTSLSYNKTQIFHMNDQIKSVCNAFDNTINILHNIDQKNLVKIKKDFISNICAAYLFHSVEIIRKGKLALCTEDNIKGYVGILDVLKILFFHKIWFKKRILISLFFYLNAKLFFSNRKI
jgi:glycosyltransferase involved in cell wall biosynthesis